MKENYSREELNAILLSKPLSDFYIVTIENKQDQELTEEEYQKLNSRDSVYTGVSKEEIDDLINPIKNDESLKNVSDQLFRAFLSLAQIRHIGILTIVNGEAYDIANSEFIDLRRNKIIHYEVFTTYYDETNARLKLFTKAEEPRLQEDTILLDVDDESHIYTYEIQHINQKEDEDLTSKLLSEIKGRTYTLKRDDDSNN